MKETRVLIGMSGGVDSSAAAYLLKAQGYDCLGATMLLRKAEAACSGGAVCGSGQDARDAQAVCLQMGIPFRAFDFSEAFNREVVGRFIRAYESGATPNPCIDCNRCLKFDALFRQAEALGCTHIATGHYARIERAGSRFLLKKGLDESKDQSYVLYSLTQAQLARTLLPLGTYRKPEIRAMAQAQGLATAEKKDSQDICFVPDGDYAAFIRRRTGKDYAPGLFVDEAGAVLGTHRGLIFYTVGQRRGLGVNGGRPLYVKELRPESNTIVLAENSALYQRTAIAGNFNWSAIDAPAGEISVKARCRYHQPEREASAQVLPGGQVRVTFREPQRAITRGQAIVLYDGDTVVGGGTILEAED